MSSHDVVLLVDDSREVAEIFARLFQTFGARYQLHTVGSADLAKAYVQGEEKYTNRKQYPLPDLLLLDLKIPNIDGSEVLEWIRRQEQLNDVRVVVLADPNETLQISRAYQMGANAFLAKPPTFGELRDVLLSLQSQETQESEVPEIAEGPMVVVKSEFMGLREAFEQICSPSPIKALESIESAKAHLEKQAGKHKSGLPLFVDLDLGESAFELIEWVKRDPRLAETHVIVLCKPGDIQSLSRAADCGAELFVVKPLTAEKLSQIGGRTSWKQAKLQRNYLDKEQAEREDMPRQGEGEAAGTEAVNLSCPGVLYVADNLADCHLFSTAMTQGSATFPVEFFRSFADVVKYLRHRGESRRVTSASPRCLLLDKTTVGEASREILRWIRKQSGFPELLVVVFSKTDNPGSVKAMYRAGADYYLVKPKSFGGLLSMVNIIDLGLRQIPSALHDLAHLPEYRDRFGNAAAAGAVGNQCAE